MKLPKKFLPVTIFYTVTLLPTLNANFDIGCAFCVFFLSLQFFDVIECWISFRTHLVCLYETICKLRRQFSLTWDDFRILHISHIVAYIPHTYADNLEAKLLPCADTFSSLSFRMNIMSVKNHHYLLIHRCILTSHTDFIFCYFLWFFLYFLTPTISLPFFYVWWWWCCE